MKKAVSVSLGSPTRDKRVIVNLRGTDVELERIGTGADLERTKELFQELDGRVDALSLGGMDLYVRLDHREYPIRAAHKLVQGVKRTPLIDGRMLKLVMEGRLWDLLGSSYTGPTRFQHAFMPFSIDRLGLAEAVGEVADEITFGDLMFALEVPIPIRGLKNLKRWARVLLPIVSYMPLSMILPPGTKGEQRKPKHIRFWEKADLIVGDMHYLYTYAPENLDGKWVITNTTTPDNLKLLRERGVVGVITTTPRYEGRSFGVNMMEAALTAYAGKGRPLHADELNQLIDELSLKPIVTQNTPPPG